MNNLTCFCKLNVVGTKEAMGSFYIRHLNLNIVEPKQCAKDSTRYDLSSAKNCIILAKGKA